MLASELELQYVAAAYFRLWHIIFRKSDRSPSVDNGLFCAVIFPEKLTQSSARTPGARYRRRHEIVYHE
jgi:hypothetical protein